MGYPWSAGDRLDAADLNSAIADAGMALLTTKSLASPATSLTTDAFTGKKFLQIIITCPSTVSPSQLGLQFNADTGNNYDYLASENSAAASGSTGYSAFIFEQNQQSGVRYIIFDVYDSASLAKKIVGKGMIEGGIQIFCSGRWNNAVNQITSIKLFPTASNNMGAGTEITVFGRD